MLAASGKDVILLETVGVGQDEVEIVGTADVSLVVLVPGLGDEVQALKAGIMEIADVFVVNKADREGAERVVAEIESMLSLASEHGHVPAIVKTVASEDRGVDELLLAIEDFRKRSRVLGPPREQAARSPAAAVRGHPAGAADRARAHARPRRRRGGAHGRVPGRGNPGPLHRGGGGAA